MTDDKLYTSLSANTTMAKVTNHFQRTKLITSSTDKHYSLNSEDDFRSSYRNVTHQQQFFSELHSPGRSYYTNCFLSGKSVFGMKSTCFFKWNQHLRAVFCGNMFLWNRHLSVFEVKSTVLSLAYMFSEISILLFAKRNQHLCGHAFLRNQHFDCFKCEVSILELVRSLKSTFCYLVSEINISVVTP